MHTTGEHLLCRRVVFRFWVSVRQLRPTDRLDLQARPVKETASASQGTPEKARTATRMANFMIANRRLLEIQTMETPLGALSPLLPLGEDPQKCGVKSICTVVCIPPSNVTALVPPCLGSWFVDDTVASDATMYYATPMDPLFVLLPRLEDVRRVTDGPQCPS